MRVRTINEEDYSHYREPSMVIGTCFCTFKCCHEGGFPETECHNSEMDKLGITDISGDDILALYESNPISKALVFAGLEPLLQFDEVCDLSRAFRTRNKVDPIIVYTGYKKVEVPLVELGMKEFSPVIIKYGRYVPNQRAHYDEILGVDLVSDGQYAVTL